MVVVRLHHDPVDDVEVARQLEKLILAVEDLQLVAGAAGETEDSDSWVCSVLMALLLSCR